jgi:hypothetical protein
LNAARRGTGGPISGRAGAEAYHTQALALRSWRPSLR